MRKMSVEERKAHIEAMAKERESIQKEINGLSKARRKYVAEKQKAEAESGEETLDSAMIKAVREQAKKKDFKFDK